MTPSLEFQEMAAAGRERPAPSLAQSAEEEWAEKREPEHRQVMARRANAEGEGAWKMTKEDCADLSLDDLPPEVSASGAFEASVETLLLNVWGEIFEASKQKGPCERLNERIALWPVFAPLLENSAAQIEMLAMLWRRYGKNCCPPYPRDALETLQHRGWPLPLVMEAARGLFYLRAQGRLEDGWLVPLLERLKRWFSRILRRLEEMARQPGATSRRLAAAVDRMRERSREVAGMLVNLTTVEIETSGRAQVVKDKTQPQVVLTAADRELYEAMKAIESSCGHPYKIGVNVVMRDGLA